MVHGPETFDTIRNGNDFILKISIIIQILIPIFQLESEQIRYANINSLM